MADAAADDDDDDEDGAGVADTSKLNAMFSKAPEGEGSAAYECLESRINRKLPILTVTELVLNYLHPR